MSLIKLISATTLAMALMLSLMTTQVSAQTASQEQEQRSDVNCRVNVGAYGQSSSAECDVDTYQRQTQRMEILGASTRIVYGVDGRPLNVVVDTGLDFVSLLAASGTMVTGVAAFIIKNRVA